MKKKFCPHLICWRRYFLIMNVLKMIQILLQTGPSEARCFVHPVVGSSLQSEASAEQQSLAQQPSPQSGQFRWVFAACSAPPPWDLQETLNITQCLVMLRWNNHRSTVYQNTGGSHWWDAGGGGKVVPVCQAHVLAFGNLRKRCREVISAAGRARLLFFSSKSVGVFICCLDTVNFPSVARAAGVARSLLFTKRSFSRRMKVFY